MTQNVSVLACGIFRPELESVLQQMSDGQDRGEVSVHYVEAALHVDDKRLMAGITDATGALEGDDQASRILLYGSMCHPEMKGLAKSLDAVLPPQANCIEMLLEPKRKMELDETGEIFYLTSGWLASWREIFQQGLGWDEIDGRINFGRYDQILVLDDGCFPIDEENVFEFFDYTQVPVEIEPIDLAYFKGIVEGLLQSE
jgi:hypothetical protein